MQTPEERARLDSLVDCIMCGACYGACPSARDNAAYLGPHAMLKALRFIEDSRDGTGEERLSLAASDDGVFRCHSVFNCQTVCPQELDPSAAIARIRRRSLGSRLKPKPARHAPAKDAKP
ncbi:MAG: 4Fe-4S dicluster domain-containing protein [Proteobacteria bacterium]|nr:4Fe-4S dicluster domain-containing protein [Pseudomonadota bacterium]